MDGTDFAELIFTDSACSMIVTGNYISAEAPCTDIGGNEWVKSGLVDSILDQERYIDGVFMTTSSTTACTLTESDDDNEANIDEYLFGGINHCLGFVFGGADVAPTYCEGNQLTFTTYSSGTCGGTPVGIENALANTNCQGDGTDSVVGAAFGYSGFTCASSTTDRNDDDRKHGGDVSLFETNAIISSDGSLNAKGYVAIASVVGVVAAVAAAAMVIFKRSRPTDFEPLKNEV
jgi:hypothetical protein